MKWLRLYDDLLDDPKAQRLPGKLFKQWINLLCLANKGEPRGTLPPTNDIAFRLRMKPSDAETMMTALEESGLMERTETGWQPHNWTERQRKSDDVAARQAKLREEKSAQNLRETSVKHSRASQFNGGNNRGSISKHAESNVTSNATVTVLEADIDTDIEKEQQQHAREDVPPLPALPPPDEKYSPVRTPCGVVDYETAKRFLLTSGVPLAHIEQARDILRNRGKPISDWLQMLRLKIGDLYPPERIPDPPPRKTAAEIARAAEIAADLERERLAASALVEAAKAKRNRPNLLEVVTPQTPMMH